MKIDGCELAFDTMAKFHNCFYVSGWFHSPEDALADISLAGQSVHSQYARINQSHDGLRSTYEQNLGFFAQALLGENYDVMDLRVIFVLASGRAIEIRIEDIARDQLATNRTPKILELFREKLGALPSARVLDLGGRNRSGVDRSTMFNATNVSVLDILPGSNVDFVGDAHQLQTLFAPKTFDAVASISVFEHLLMPWKVVLAINHVLKPGGLAYIYTHQTIGMHDLPWDYWRFSSDAWDALFNSQTGFRILERGMDGPQFVIPMFFRTEKLDAEKAVGFEGSAVLVEKIADTSLSWDVDIREVISSTYPTEPSKSVKPSPADTIP